MTDPCTDERMDDLSKRVDDGFRDMQAEFGSVRSEMQPEFGSVRGEIGALRSETRDELGSVRKELAALNRTLIITLATLASLIGAMAAAYGAHPF